MASDLNAEFLKLVQEQGMSSIASDVGLITKGGALTTNIPSATKITSGKKRSSDSQDAVESSAKKPKKRIQRADGMTGRGGKASKGLRHFSAKVCEKVKQKGTTTYNQVADELVREFAARVLNNAVDQQYDEKNIRRRVYDALNVLMAMDIIIKDRKNISWHGLPANVDHDLEGLARDEIALKNSIVHKKKHLSRILQNVRWLLVVVSCCCFVFLLSSQNIVLTFFSFFLFFFFSFFLFFFFSFFIDLFSHVVPANHVQKFSHAKRIRRVHQTNGR